MVQSGFIREDDTWGASRVLHTSGGANSKAAALLSVSQAAPSLGPHMADVARDSSGAFCKALVSFTGAPFSHSVITSQRTNLQINATLEIMLHCMHAEVKQTIEST